MSAFDNLANQIKKRFGMTQSAIANLRQSGVIGNEAGTVNVPALPGFVWVKIGSAPAIPVLNKRVAATNGMPVYVGFDPVEPHLYQVLGSAVGSNEMGAMNPSGNSNTGMVGPHGPTHGFLGGDPTFIDKRQILPGRIGPAVPGTYTTGDAVLEIWPDVIPNNTGTGVIQLAAQVIDLTSRIPATTGYACYVCVSVDTTGAVNLTNGTATPGETPDLATLPAVPTSQYLCGWVRLRNGMTYIADGEDTDILDPRTMQTVVGGGVGLGNVLDTGATVANHLAIWNGASDHTIKDGGLPLAAGTATPAALGTAAAGSATNVSHEDHVHPTGDVVHGPASAADNHMAVFDSTTGKLIKDGGAVPSGVGHTIESNTAPMTTRANLNFTGAGVSVTDNPGNSSTDVNIPGGGSGGGDYVKITEVIVTTPAANIDITSIPGTYRNLKIFFQGRSDNVSGSKSVNVTINADAGNNYYTETLQFYGTTTGSTESLGSALIVAAWMPQSNAATGLSGAAEITIFNYSLTAFVKHISILAQQARITGSGGTAEYHKVAWWNNTAAITRITFTPSANNFDTGTIVSVYGMN